MAYWLMKSEPHVFGIDHLVAVPNQTEPWDGGGGAGSLSRPHRLRPRGQVL